MSGANRIRTAAYALFLRVFARLPRRLRRWLVWAGSPHYTVGALCVVRRADGAVLLVRHTYQGRWGAPGGMTRRGEPPEQAAVRETAEEVGLAVELEGAPAVVVDPAYRRVDVVVAARPSPLASLDDVRPSSPEIAETRWFAFDDLPQLQPETASALGALARAGRLDALPGSGRPAPAPGTSTPGGERRAEGTERRVDGA